MWFICMYAVIVVEKMQQSEMQMQDSSEADAEQGT